MCAAIIFKEKEAINLRESREGAIGGVGEQTKSTNDVNALHMYGTKISK